ncbi:hypothetical protein KC340_g114 [Hortaea werneckii]|nr:hypothetical protein KC340_g114 [Hortaea werneckii]
MESTFAILATPLRKGSSKSSYASSISPSAKDDNFRCKAISSRAKVPVIQILFVVIVVSLVIFAIPATLSNSSQTTTAAFRPFIEGTVDLSPLPALHTPLPQRLPLLPQLPQCSILPSSAVRGAAEIVAPAWIVAAASDGCSIAASSRSKAASSASSTASSPPLAGTSAGGLTFKGAVVGAAKSPSPLLLSSVDRLSVFGASSPAERARFLSSGEGLSRLSAFRFFPVASTFLAAAASLALSSRNVCPEECRWPCHAASDLIIISQRLHSSLPSLVYEALGCVIRRDARSARSIERTSAIADQMFVVVEGFLYLLFSEGTLPNKENGVSYVRSRYN